MLGFSSVMQRERPVFTAKDRKGIQPVVTLSLSGLPRCIRKLLGYSGISSALVQAGGQEYNVFGGIGNIFHPRISFGYREPSKEGAVPKPPTTGVTHPGYAFGDYLRELFGDRHDYAYA